MLAVGLMLGAVAVSASACGSSKAGAASAPVAKAKTVNISMIGKIDADKGPVGTFTSKEHWPAMAPSDLTFGKGDTVVLTSRSTTTLPPLCQPALPTAPSPAAP